MYEIAQRCTNLEWLSLSGNPLFTDELVKLMIACPVTNEARGDLLRTLDLSYCKQLTGAGVRLLADGGAWAAVSARAAAP